MAYLNARKAQLAASAGDGFAQRYRRQAETCRERSERAEDPRSRSILLRFAALYQDMANQFAASADAPQADRSSGPVGPSSLSRS